MIDEIKKKHHNVPEKCSKEMFALWLKKEDGTWIEGTGDKKRTWGTVMTALESAGRHDLVENIKSHFKKKFKGTNCFNLCAHCPYKALGST